MLNSCFLCHKRAVRYLAVPPIGESAFGLFGKNKLLLLFDSGSFSIIADALELINVTKISTLAQQKALRFQLNLPLLRSDYLHLTIDDVYAPHT